MNLRTESFKEEVVAALWAIVAIESFRSGYTVIGIATTALSVVSMLGSVYYAWLYRRFNKASKEDEP